MVPEERTGFRSRSISMCEAGPSVGVLIGQHIVQGSTLIGYWFVDEGDFVSVQVSPMCTMKVCVPNAGSRSDECLLVLTVRAVFHIKAS